jgi:hypothetical protein
VSEEFVTKQINKLNVKKATGHDGISPKILKMAQQKITNPITKLVNKSIDSSIFPADLKSAQVVIQSTFPILNNFQQGSLTSKTRSEG